MLLFYYCVNQPKKILQFNLGLSIVYVPSFIVYWNILDAHLEVTCSLHGLLFLVHLPIVNGSMVN